MSSNVEVPGLENLGHTCYINATLQALASCGEVVHYLQNVLQDPPLHAGGGTPAQQAPPPAGFAAALLECLLALAPGPPGGRSFNPGRVLDELRRRVGPDTLPAGEEHDAAEALEVICGLLAEDLQHLFHSGGAQGRLGTLGALAAVLASPGGSAVSGPGPADPLLACWRRSCRPPWQGSGAQELCCLSCRHRFQLQLQLFVVVPLSVPAAPGRTLLGNVPAALGASLLGCLQQHFAFEAIAGVGCTRCSVDASLAAAAAAAGAEGSLPPSLEALRSGLAAGGVLPESEAHEAHFRELGCEWVVQRSTVARRAVLALLPKTLCLQLRRTHWTAAGAAKVQGPVAFPLELDLQQLPWLGHEQQLLSATSSSSCRYRLRAVVQHAGFAGSGHYWCWRQLQPSGCWVRVSDEAVGPASEEEVLEAEASLLLYEREDAEG